MKIFLTVACLASLVSGQTVNQETIAWGERRNSMMKASRQEQDAKINAAIKDWRAQKPLPGLPSLKKPVRVKVGSYVCNTAGGLLNPHIQELMFLHECMITSHTVLVRVLQPVNESDYITGYVHEIVEISYQSGDVSDGNVYTAWVPIATLSNSTVPQ